MHLLHSYDTLFNLSLFDYISCLNTSRFCIFCRVFNVRGGYPYMQPQSLLLNFCLLLPTAHSHNHSHQFYTKSLFVNNRPFGSDKVCFLKWVFFPTLKDGRKEEKHNFQVKLRINALQFSAFSILIKLFKNKCYYTIVIKKSYC